ncbi:AIG2-like protein D isoform X2 [Cucurbita maxima]|uniref:Putative gamma-glutamylcyclotransferase n=1 Tax=Cucurbita maxima TaxID=3661 RepID=A0A6J1IX74_CUCMA|nr:AIG2-like protein D isoform X2 [Cucurbita maxima]
MDSASLASLAPSLAPSHTQQNLHRVFVYGSLLSDEVVHILLKRTPQSSAAVLNDFQRLTIKGRVYPAIIPVDGKKVSGKVLSGITDTELDILDAFEDVEYKRSTVEVSLTALDNLLLDSLEKLLVYVYIWNNERDPDLYGDWDFEEWKRAHLDAYLEMVNEFIEEFEHHPPQEQCVAVDEAGQRCEQPLHSPEEEEPSKLNCE